MNLFFSRLTRTGLLAGCLWLSAPAAMLRAASSAPVTIKELCMMLRGGYTGDEVLRETAGRPLQGSFDADAEKALAQAGADVHFIDAFQASHRVLTDDEIAALQQRKDDIARRKLEAWEDNSARLLEVHRQAAENAVAQRKQAMLGKMAEQLRGQLVTCQASGLQPYDATALAGKKLFAFYFASLSNPNCSKFTPQLLKFYQDFAPTHPAFEVVFFSEDRSAFNMENSMRQGAMPWPALGFDHLAQQADLVALGKQAVPRLTLIDGAGRIVSDSVVDGKYVGPQHVLDDLTRLAAGGSADVASQ